MANIAKGWAVGDTVWVRYGLPSSDYLVPQSRDVASADIISATDNAALVKFTNGNSVNDDDTIVRVYTTQALCAAGIEDEVITSIAATVALDATTSSVSTAGNASTALIRLG